MVSRLKGEKSEGGCEASFLAGETSGLTNPIPEPLRSSAAAEKSVEGTALKTRTGARQIAADHHPCLAYITTLFVIEPKPNRKPGEPFGPPKRIYIRK